MTRNQIDYLGLEETKRNNLVVSEETKRANQARERETNRNNLVMEAQGADKNAETKRNNLVVSKEQKRHNKATEKIQRTVPIYQSSIASEAQKYGANTSAAASRYTANVTAAYQYANQANQAAIATANRKSNENIEKAKNATNVFLKKLDSLMNDKRLTQSEKESLRDAYTKIKMQNDKLSFDSTQKDLDRQVKMLTDTQGLIASLTTTTGANIVGSSAAKYTTKSGLSATVRGAINSAESKKSGAKPASAKSESDKRSTTRNLVINTKSTSKKTKSKSPKVRVSSGSHASIRKRNTGKSKNGWLTNPLGKVK